MTNQWHRSGEREKEEEKNENKQANFHKVQVLLYHRRNLKKGEEFVRMRFV